ncbi:metal dependent phosphohydrolase [Xylaria arbuscula]|nr:metal dependent phosphohydrolase [Xylaria arbuscula]
MSSPFPTLPKSKLTFPSSPITTAAFAYTKQHTSEAVYNHCARSAYFALLLARKLPAVSAAGKKLDLEVVVLACVLHDMGWSHNKALLSEFKRFEVDGADIARAFISAYDGVGREDWGEGRVQRVWDAIALHTTRSIAPFAAAEVAAAHLGVTADFMGPRFPSDPFGDPAGQTIDNPEAVITVEEFREILAAFPYAGFGEDAAKEVLCGLCRDKPVSTFDNFVGGFGREYGFDGKGAGREEYRKMFDEATSPQMLLGNFGYLRKLLDRED